MPPPTALLLIAHGSRRPEANADLDRVADAMRGRGGYDIVRTAYLELAEPDIPTGGANCVAAGAAVVTLLPYFLSAGVHVQDDIAAARGDLAARFPAVAFRVAPHLGLHPLMLDIVAARAAEAAEAGGA